MLYFIMSALVFIVQLVGGLVVGCITLAVIAVGIRYIASILPQTNPIHTYKLEDGRILVGPDKELGHGAFGGVYQYRLEDTPVAVKKPVDQNYNYMQSHELEILHRVNPHPNIIQL
ncbi:MAG: hypothetical protein ACHP6H_03790, partial [Legionellales bacterium]